jgi:hypothetical protein
VSTPLRRVGSETKSAVALNKGLDFGFGYARLFAGQFLQSTTHDTIYQYPCTYFEYSFSKSGFYFPITPTKPN